jgi:predicted phage-related endonuclease
MTQKEEQAREYFDETRDILQLFCLSGWIAEFQKRVQDFITERLDEAANIIAEPGSEMEDIIRLHGLRRLVAGAVQEEELVRQPDYAFACAKLDRAIIWDGRGYVIKTHYFFMPHASPQSEFEEVSKALWLVMPIA